MRVPRAWGSGGEGMADGADIPLPYPETAVIEGADARGPGRRRRGVASAAPVVVGGCCCSHVGGARGLARRVGRLAVVWIDAHGDLNTPETSPSGNEWGMPFRMILDSGDVAPGDAALVGARNLDPPEAEYMAAVGLDDSLDRALADVDATYVALDLDVLDPTEVDVLVPESDGLSPDELEVLLADLAARTAIAGIGVTGFLRAGIGTPSAGSRHADPGDRRAGCEIARGVSSSSGERPSDSGTRGGPPSDRARRGRAQRGRVDVGERAIKRVVQRPDSGHVLGFRRIQVTRADERGVLRSDVAGVEDHPERHSPLVARRRCLRRVQVAGVDPDDREPAHSPSEAGRAPPT